MTETTIDKLRKWISPLWDDMCIRSLITVLMLAVTAYVIILYPHHAQTIISFLAMVILAVTAHIVARYTRYTRRLRDEAAKQADATQQLWDEAAKQTRFTQQLWNEAAKQTSITQQLLNETAKQTTLLRKESEADAVVSGLSRMANRDSYAWRRYLHKYFIEDLKKVLEDKPKNGFKDLEEFNERLEDVRKETPLPGVEAFNPLQAVEWTLLDFHMVALPVYMGIESAWQMAEAYRPTLGRISEKILPFIEIQRELRGDSDPEYMKHYLHLLDKLLIELPTGLNPPPDPNSDLFLPDHGWEEKKYEPPLDLLDYDPILKKTTGEGEIKEGCDRGDPSTKKTDADMGGD
ncbi:MAG: hypothetical protein JRI80_19690 [Deltaproteobacteria bacterium]|nr:hypothetical protein [Deltaproteobacteria bacterium]